MGRHRGPRHRQPHQQHPRPRRKHRSQRNVMPERVLPARRDVVPQYRGPLGGGYYGDYFGQRQAFEVFAPVAAARTLWGTRRAITVVSSGLTHPC